MSLEKFSNKGKQYAKGRPGYPIEAIDYIKTLAKDAIIVGDIGAGTGKFTELLAQAGYDVFAVEPNADMYEQLKLTHKEYPNVKFVLATSEETQLADDSVDIITVAQALHWFDLEKFKAECKRILRPGGWVIALYNEVSYNNNIVLCDEEKKDVKVQAKQRKNFAHLEFFDNPVMKEFATTITYTKETWIAYMLSHSHSPLPSDKSYNEYIEKVNAIFDCESSGNQLHREIVTTIYAEQLT